MEKLSLNQNHIEVLSQYGLKYEYLKNCQIHIYNSNEHLLYQDDEVLNLYILIKGDVFVYVNGKNGKKLILCHYQSKGIIGEISLMLNEYISSTTVKAISQVECIAIDLKKNAKYLKENIQFLNIIGQNLSLNLLNRSHAHISSAMYNSEERLCSYILLSHHNGIFKEYLTDTAQSIGISYRHVFRIINRLCKENILEKTNNGYKIINMKELENKGKY